MIEDSEDQENNFQGNNFANQEDINNHDIQLNPNRKKNIKQQSKRKL